VETIRARFIVAGNMDDWLAFQFASNRRKSHLTNGALQMGLLLLRPYPLQ
jgi:hypothetical protein